jgi:hypothetical protein
MSNKEYVFLEWSMNEKPMRTSIHQPRTVEPTTTELTTTEPPNNMIKSNVSYQMHKDEYVPNAKTVDREKISDIMSQRMPMAQFTMNPFIQSDYLQDLDNQEKFLKPLNSSYTNEVQKEVQKEVQLEHN